MAILETMPRGAVIRGAAIRGAVVRGATVSALMMVALGCGGPQQRPAESAAAPESVSDAPVGEAPQCVDDKEQPVACMADGDCCSGFVCGKDPELSARTSYCIFGG